MTLTPFEQNMVKEFVSKRMQQKSSKNLYSKRGSVNTQKIKKDITNGAVSEIVCYNYLSRLFDNIEISQPDFEIYDSSMKSFEADLFLDRFGVHIKSIDKKHFDSRGGSWLFQVEDNLFKPDSNELIMVTVVDCFEVDVIGLYKVSDISKAGIIKEPLLERFKGIKQALYFEDLEKIENKLK